MLHLSTHTYKTKTLATGLMVIFGCLRLFSQIGETRNYNLTTNANSVGIGFSSIADPYLSPFEYIGMGVEYISESQKFYSQRDTLLSVNQTLSLNLGQAKHPTNINSMQYFGGNYDVGYHYNWRLLKNFTCLLGGSWDIYLGGKYIARNVNNPFSLDLSTHLNISLSANYRFNIQVFRWFNQDFRIEYGVKTPVSGCVFVPQQGESYYEIFSLSNYKDVFHFTAFHNERTIHQRINLDIPVKFTTFRIGLNHDFVQYKANDMVFHKNNLAVSIGWISSLYVFQGTKNKPPRNFRQSY